MAQVQLGIGDLVAQLRDLASQNPRSKSELESLESASALLLLQIRNSTSLPVLPEAIWHFLSDADVRFKDPLYATSQLAGLTQALVHLESSSVT